jgi:hypothetical protein
MNEYTKIEWRHKVRMAEARCSDLAYTNRLYRYTLHPIDRLIAKIARWLLR